MANKCKYYKEKLQYKYTEESTWHDVTPAEYRKGALYEYESEDCGEITPIYRWNVDYSDPHEYGSNWTCYNEYKQVSYDNGETWENVEPVEVRVDQTCTGDCRCQGIPGGTDGWWEIAIDYVANGNSYRIWAEGEPCGTPLHSYTITRYVASSAVTGITAVQTCTGVADRALTGCTNLEILKLPCSTTSIGEQPFNAPNMQFITIEAMDVPSIKSTSFYNTNNCRILVYSNVVDKYKAAWPNLANRIQAIS